jgi:tetratricopeptide (TPR) repeat protein
MRQYQAAIDNTSVFSSRFDSVTEWLLVTLLAFMPLAFGVVHAWSEEVVIALSGTIVICFLLKLVLNHEQHMIWSWAYIPVGIFILVVILQLIPLPTSLVSIISPNTARLKTELLGDLPNAGAVLKLMTFSFYPNATKHDLRLVLAVAGVFVVVLNVFRRPDQIKRLLTAIAIIGGIIILISLAQNMFGNGKLYWFVSTRYKNLHSGPFVNHSHFGQFMNLSIGAALGVLMAKLKKDFSGKKITPPVVFEYLSSSAAKTIWLLITLIGLGMAMIFISLTRGGMVSMLIAAAFTTLVVTSQHSLKGHGWIMLITTLVAFSCTLYIGFDAIYERLTTLQNLDQYESRWQILKDLSVCFRCFPVLGVGLGTHSVVYPMFDRSTIAALATHAENEYAQLLEETGLIGLGLLIIFGTIVLCNYIRNIRNADLPIRSTASGIGFGILAILLHSLSDFGQHLPANAFLTAIFCALLLRMGRHKPNQQSVVTKVSHTLVYKGLRITALLSVSAIWVWIIIGANNARIAESHWAKVRVIEKNLVVKNWHGTKDEYSELIFHASTALNYQPENIQYHHWLNVYRWCSIGHITDFNNRAIPEDSMPYIREIVKELHKARILCPTFGATYCMLGQIEKFILNDQAGIESIKKGFHLAPCDPITCFVAGNLDISEGRFEDCVEKFNKAVQLDGRLFGAVVKIYVNQLSRPDLAVLIAGEDIGRLSYVASILEDMQYTDLADQVREKKRDLLEAKCSQPDAPPSALASLADIYKKQQINEAAIEYYRRALALDYSQIHWRLNLAKLLAETDQVPEAIHETRICLRLQPQLKGAIQLLGELSVHPEALSESK